MGVRRGRLWSWWRGDSTNVPEIPIHVQDMGCQYMDRIPPTCRYMDTVSDSDAPFARLQCPPVHLRIEWC